MVKPEYEWYDWPTDWYWDEWAGDWYWWELPRNFYGGIKNMIISEWVFYLLAFILFSGLTISWFIKRRPWVLLAFYLSNIVNCIASVLLLFSGQGLRLIPGENLCIVNAALVDASRLAVNVAAFAVFLHYLLVAIDGNAARPIRFRRGLVLIPLLVFLAFLGMNLALGFSDHSRASRWHGAHYCTLLPANGIWSRWPWTWWTTMISAVLLLVTTIMFYFSTDGDDHLRRHESYKHGYYDNIILRLGIFLIFDWTFWFVIALTTLHYGNNPRFLMESWRPFYIALIFLIGAPLWRLFTWGRSDDDEDQPDPEDPAPGPVPPVPVPVPPTEPPVPGPVPNPGPAPGEPNQPSPWPMPPSPPYGGYPDHGHWPPSPDYPCPHGNRPGWCYMWRCWANWRDYPRPYPPPHHPPSPSPPKPTPPFPNPTVPKPPNPQPGPSPNPGQPRPPGPGGPPRPNPPSPNPPSRPPPSPQPNPPPSPRPDPPRPTPPRPDPPRPDPPRPNPPKPNPPPSQPPSRPPPSPTPRPPNPSPNPGGPKPPGGGGPPRPGGPRKR